LLERIVQAGKKKLVLDHVIVQKMDAEEGGADVRSILTYGALALFDEAAATRDINCTFRVGYLSIAYSSSSDSEQDLDKLIEKTETEEAPREETREDTGQAFTFAKVWTAENEVLEELEDQELERTETTDTWAHALQLIAKEQAQVKAEERTGRGVRRKAAIAAENQVQSVVPPPRTDALTSFQQKFDFLDTPVKDKARGKKRKLSKSTVSEESDAYVNADPSQSEISSEERLGAEVEEDTFELGVPMIEGSVPPRLSTKHHSSFDRVGQPTSTYAPHDRRDPPDHPQETAICSMCGNAHQGTCDMTERSENLVHYRRILFTEHTGESLEERVRPLDMYYLCEI
jgi:chromodomain-helicase-DNA-binding protein 4